ncbi:MAG: cellulase family glycosylhydrolase [Exilispira sp.]
MIKSQNGYFVDEKGRILIFRGCNFSADSKIPAIPDGSTHNKDCLKRDKISFVSRPCKLEEADQHFERMKKWGFNFLRFLVTWEAIEPQKPEVYDEQYINYIKEILEKAKNYGFFIYIDPHQDVYSRFSGGDGAPWWTFDAVGIDVDKIGKTFSALLHKDYPENLPSMIWPTNYNRYAAATMFTLFFAGKDFAPNLNVEGQNIQNWLQTKYINAIKYLAFRLKDNENIIGFGSMNEPHMGYIGYTDLNTLQNCSYAKGYIPTGFQSMQLASGFPVYVNRYNEGFFGYKPIGKKLFNKDKVSLFKDGKICPWRVEGVWDIENGKPVLKKPDYFSKVNNKKVDFANDYLKPFILKYQKAINEINPDWFTIVEGLPQGQVSSFNQNESKKMIHGFHWYDGLPMALKVFLPFFSIRSDNRKPVFGRKNIVNSFYQQINDMKENTKKNMGNMPCLLGEFGLPFDVFYGISYKIKNFVIPNTAISMFYDALDRVLISSTIWTYCVNNNNKHGDNWNKEDFSIYCKENDLSKRATPGFLRPYPKVINGKPILFKYDNKKKTIVLVFENKDENFNFDIEQSTIIFIPDLIYSKEIKYKIKLDDKTASENDYQVLINKDKQEFNIKVNKKAMVEILIEYF